MLACSIPGVNCATDITLVNCPSQFNITKANQTTADNVNFIESFYSTFQTSADNARIENIVVTGDTADLWAYIK